VDPVDGPTLVPSDEEIRALRRKTHQTIRKVTEDLESFSFNTAVAALMELRNTLQEAKKSALYQSEAWDEAVRSLLLLLCPIAPHITEELWERLGLPFSIHQQSWPKWDDAVAAEEMITLVVQVNGRVRDRIEVPAGISEEEAKEVALSSERVRYHMEEKEPRKVIYIAGKLVNIVV
jgi:leucyl-tRNA synthetase